MRFVVRLYFGGIMIHLVCGPIGAGKTTYVITLAKKENAIRFSEVERFSVQAKTDHHCYFSLCETTSQVVE